MKQFDANKMEGTKQMKVFGGWAYIDEPKEKLKSVLDSLEKEAAGRNFYTDNGRFQEDINGFRLYDKNRKYYEDDPWKIISILRKYLNDGIKPEGW